MSKNIIQFQNAPKSSNIHGARANYTRRAILSKLSALNVTPIDFRSLHETMDAAFAIASTCAGYLADFEDRSDHTLCWLIEELVSQLDLLSMSANHFQAGCREDAACDLALAVSSIIEAGADILGLPALERELPALRRAIWQRSVQVFEHDIDINPRLMINFCWGLDRDIRHQQALDAILKLEQVHSYLRRNGPDYRSSVLALVGGPELGDFSDEDEVLLSFRPEVISGEEARQAGIELDAQLERERIETYGRLSDRMIRLLASDNLDPLGLAGLQNAMQSYQRS